MHISTIYSLYVMVSVKTYVGDKNRLPTRIPARPSQWHIMIHYSETPLPVSAHAFMPGYNTCIHACLGATSWSSGAAWRMTVAPQSPRAAPRCSSAPWSVPISLVPPQKTGHPFLCSEMPDFSIRSPPGRRMQTWGILDRLKFSRSMCSTAYWFFPPSHFISFISCGFMSNCELDKKKC